MENKRSIIEHIMGIPGVKKDDIAMNFLEGELKKLKKTVEDKEVEREAVRAEIIDIMTEIRKPMTAKEIGNVLKNPISFQKVVNLISPLISHGVIKRDVIKGVVYFSLA